MDAFTLSLVAIAALAAVSLGLISLVSHVIGRFRTPGETSGSCCRDEPRRSNKSATD
jgi:hypothetical protein